MSPIVVIGAGLSGLAAAAHLGNHGHSVIVLEAGADIGGCCSTDDVGGFRFNNGAVYVATPALLRHAFSRLGLDFDAHVRLHPIAVPQLSILDSGTRVFTTTAAESRVEGRNAAARTARYRMELERLLDGWRPLYRRLIENLLPHDSSLPRALFELWRYLPRMSGSVAGLLEKNFSDAETRAAVGAIMLYTGLAPERTPATQMVGLIAMLEEGFFLPEGGMGRIPQAIGDKLRGNGGELRLRTAASRIEYRDGRLLGVRLSDGELLPASAVIASTSALDVVEHLLDPAIVPAPLRRRAERAPLSHRAISIQLGITQAAAAEAFAINRIPLLDEQHRFHEPAEREVRWFSHTRPSAILPWLAPEGAEAVEMFAPAPPGRRAAEIGADETAEIAARYIDALRKDLPGSIVEQRVLGPADFARERHLYEGALYGLAPGARPTEFFPRRAGLDGLYLAGQTTFPGYGVPTALLSGVHAADAVMRAMR
jgi:phytoene desaturase